MTTLFWIGWAGMILCSVPPQPIDGVEHVCVSAPTPGTLPPYVVLRQEYVTR